MNFFDGHYFSLYHSSPEFRGESHHVPIYYGIQYNHAGKLWLQIDHGERFEVEGAYVFITHPNAFFEYGNAPGESRHHNFLCSYGERVEEYIRELERELEEGRQARGETDKGQGEMALARGEREADSLAYERTRRERELDSLRSTVYAGRSSVTYRLEGRHKVVLPIPVFKCEFGGRVVVAVTVNREGRVTRAEVVERVIYP